MGDVPFVFFTAPAQNSKAYKCATKCRQPLDTIALKNAVS